MNMQKSLGGPEDSLHPTTIVPDAKDVSIYPGNEEGSVQPTTVATAQNAGKATEQEKQTRANTERRRP